MKRTCTFFAAVFLMVSAVAAQNNNHQRDNNNGDDNYGNSNQQRDNNYGNNNPHDAGSNNNHDWHNGDRNRKYYNFAEREKDMQIAQINREYNNRIQSVRNKFFMGRYQKERIINSLQFQREEEIRSVMIKFNRRDNGYGRSDNRYHDHDNSNW